MTGEKNFTDFRFWQRSRSWSKRIYKFPQCQQFSQDKRLVSQVNDSSESVFANIAEGFGRGTQGEFVQFLGYSLGSLNETRSHLCAAYDREYLSKEELGDEFQEGTEIRKMMVAFIKSMTMHGSGGKHIRKNKSWTEEVWERFERITGQSRPDWIPKTDDSETEARGKPKSK